MKSTMKSTIKSDKIVPVKAKVTKEYLPVGARTPATDVQPEKKVRGTGAATKGTMFHEVVPQ